MARKASRSSIAKKAWKTRKANAKAAAVGVTSPIIFGSIDVKSPKVATISSLCTQIDDTLTALETRLTALNARINAIL